MLLSIGDDHGKNGPAKHMFRRIGGIQSQWVVRVGPLLGIASPRGIFFLDGGGEGARMGHCEVGKKPSFD